MSFLKRVSDGFWSYVSPTKPHATTDNDNGKINTPQTVPKFKKPARHKRRGSVVDAIGRSRSMSPVERVESWRLSGLAPASNKRKRTATGRGPGRPPKKAHRMDENDRAYTPDAEDDDSDVAMEDDRGEYAADDQDEDEDEAVDDESDEYDEEDDGEEEEEQLGAGSIEDASPGRSSANDRSPALEGYAEEYSESEIDTSIVVEEEEYHDGIKRKMLISPTEAHFEHGVSTEELRAQGWDDDHISLMQHIAMRGFEPIMPNFYHFEYRFHFPDNLFLGPDDPDDAIISSARRNHYHGLKALNRLLELGGRVRDRVMLKGQVPPEQQVRRMLREFIKWAEDDANLDRNRAIPILALETKPRDYDSEQMKQNAHRKLAALAARYRDAFRVLQSIENSPGSRTSTQLSYPVPTLYAIVASHTLIALTAYNPEDAEPEVKIVAMFDMKNKDYDVWNALALAIVVCHVRNVQLRIAEETGLGLKSPMDDIKEPSPDPDA